MENSIPSTSKVCMLCGARLVNGACPNECDIPITNEKG